MKFRTTTKHIKENYSKIISVRNGQLYTLLKNHNAIAYTTGAYGWKYDLYDIEGVAICVGNYGMPTKYSNNARKYEDTARRLIDNYDFTDYVTDITKVNQLIENILDEFIKNELAI